MAVLPNRVKAIFLEAVDKAAPAERSAYLATACAGDEGLRQRIDALLQAHEAASSVLDRPAAEQFPPSFSPEEESQAAEQIRDAKFDMRNLDRPLIPPPEENCGDEALAYLEPAVKPDTLGRLAHYDVLEILGRGGFGTVFKSFDGKLHRIVAIKMLTPALAASGTARQRFLREARAAAAVRDEHVIDIHAVEEQPSPYLVMEYVDGQTLEEKLKKAGPLPVKEILRIGYQVAAGLAAAHRQGLIHRDIKPSNILLENGVERVKLSDFGLARAVDDASLTQSGLIAGTPMYMSPEQAEARPVDHRSDLFSLGSVLYALCTGHSPFRAPSTLAVLKRVCEDTPRPIAEINNEIPDWLTSIIKQLLAKNPDDRIQSAKEVADILARYLADLQVHGHVLTANLAMCEQRIKVERKDVVDQSEPAVNAARRRPFLRFSRLRADALTVGLLGLVLAAVLLREYWPSSGSGHPSADKLQGAAPSQPANPFDTRSRKDIAPSLLALAGGGDADAAPAELVAVLGDGRFSLSGERVSEMAAAPDSRLLAVPCGGQVFLFEPHTGHLVRKFTAHNKLISRIAFSADSKQIATTSEDMTARLWDVDTCELKQTFHGHTLWVLTALVGPENKTVITASADSTVRIWDAATGKELKKLLHPDHVHGLALSPDGKWLVTGCNDRNVRVWDFTSGELNQTLSGHTDEVSCACFSADGKWLATGSGREIKWWQGATFKPVRTLSAAGQWLRFDPAGRVLLASKAAYADGEPYVVNRWDVATGQTLPSLTLKNHGGWASFALTTDGKTLFAARSTPAPDVFVRAYDAATGQELLPAQAGHAGQVSAVAFSPNGTLLASGGDDRTVRLWHLAGWRAGEALPPVRTLSGHTNLVCSVKFSPDGKLLASGSLDRTIALWDVATGTRVRTLKGHSKTFSEIAFAPDGQNIAAGQEDGTVKFWDVASGKPTSVLTSHQGAVPCVTYSPDGKLLASGGLDKTVQVYQAETEQLVKSFTLAGGVAAVAFSHDSQWLAAATDEGNPTALSVWEVGTWKAATYAGPAVRRLAMSPVTPLAAATSDADGSVRFWDIKDDAPRKLTVGLAQAAGAEVAFTPDGRYLAAAGANGMVTILRVPTPPPPYNSGPPWPVPSSGDLAQKAGPADALDALAIPRELLAQASINGQPTAGLAAVLGGKEGHAGQVYGVAIRPDGKVLASAGQDKTVRLWDLATGKLRELLPVPLSYVYCVAFSADNKLLASGSGNGDIEVRDAANGQTLRTWVGHGGRVTSVAFSPDGKLLASTGNDGSVRLWNADTGKLQRVLDKWGQPTWCAVFSPDGKTVASALGYGIVRLWDVASGWEVATLNGHMSVWIRALAFSPDGRSLASSGFHSGDPIRLWDLAQRKHRTLPALHSSPVIAVCWDGAGRLLATASDSDGTVRLWDTTTDPPLSKVLQVLPSGQKWLHGLAFTPEGRHLATANPDGTIYILRLAQPGAVVDLTVADR